VILFIGGDTHSRSVLKAISWRTLGTLDTFAISWFLTGKVGLAGSIAALEFATKIVWYYLHKRRVGCHPLGTTLNYGDKSSHAAVTRSVTPELKLSAFRSISNLNN
jgi:uncharacterized membrane protein